MAKENEWQDAVRAIKIIVALLGFVLVMVKFLLFSKNNLGAVLSFLVLAVVLWGVHDMVDEIHVCKVCGLEYRIADFSGHYTHYYCEKSPSHEHDGPRLKELDVHRGVSQLVAWMKSDMERLKRAFTEEEVELVGAPQAGSGNND